MLTEFEAIQWCKEHRAKVEWTGSHTILEIDGFFDTIVAKTVQEAVGLAIDIEEEFAEARTEQEPDWLPSAAELDEAEQEIRIGLEPGEHAFCFVCEDPDCKGCPLTEEEVKGIEAYNQIARDESGAIQSQRFL